MKTKEEIKISESSEAKDDLFEGEQLNRIVSTLKKETDKIGLIEETKRISRRVKFKRDVGLVLGQVQSGKTTSFEAVTAMLTDNKLPLTIILGGVSIVLTTQNRERVFKHFTNDGKERDWFIEDTLDGLPGNFRTNLKNNLTRWNSAARNKKGSVIVCMKDHSHISKLTKELKKLEPILEETKVLIIDDEADQYSMNTRPNINPGDKNDPSTTYSEIQSLRKCLPKHTYLQYTATPQAPFLISTVDRLSPHWVDRVTPGEDYIGFDELFKQDADGVGAHVRYVETTLDNDTEEMPESLKSAMGSFLVASAQLSLEKNDNTVEEDSRIKFDVLSMLVHPSRRIYTQEAMHDFIKTTWEDWKDATEEPDRFENNYEEFKNIIRKQWDDYAFYSPQRLKPLEEILEEIEVNVIGDIGIELINSGKRRTSETIDYSKNDFFIVISGQAMDRGTTVEGLITTYLSRGASVQEDTQIQRARFCGYKRNFMDFIRIYLDRESNERFKNYGITNADFMDLIDDCNSKDMSFKDVRREWRINAGANSCRKNVVSLKGAVVLKGKKVSKWSYPVRPHRSDFEFNNNVIENFLSKHELEKSPDSGNGEFTSHAEITLPFEEVFKSLFVDLKYKDILDSEKFAQVAFWLDRLYQDDQETQEQKFGDKLLCRVIDMNAMGNGQRKRSLHIKSKPWNETLTRFGQGANLSSGYVGDKLIFDPNAVTLQIHNFDLYSDEHRINEKDFSRNNSASPLYEGIRVPAIRLPDKVFASKYDVQSQKEKNKKSDFLGNLEDENEE